MKKINLICFPRKIFSDVGVIRIIFIFGSLFYKVKFSYLSIDVLNQNNTVMKVLITGSNGLLGQKAS